MPRSRLLAVAVAGALALAGLAACRDLPTVAAYVGDARLTNAQVEKMVADARKDPPDKNRRENAIGDLRRFTVRMFVLRELARRLAAENGITVPPVDATDLPGLATQLNVSSSALLQLVAEADAAGNAIKELSKPQAPTDPDKREVYQDLVQRQIVGPGQYEQVKDKIDSPEMRQALGLRAVLRDALHKYQVTVNPRYEPLGVFVPFTVGGVSTFVMLSLESTAPPAVADRS